jgi:hypothetical protein
VAVAIRLLNLWFIACLVINPEVSIASDLSCEAYRCMLDLPTRLAWRARVAGG